MSKTLFAVAVMCCITFSAEASTVAYYHADEGAVGSTASGANSIIDSSGNNLNGTPMGGPTYQAFTGLNNSSTALHFDGVDDAVYVQDNIKFAFQNAFTIEAYVSLDSYEKINQQFLTIFFRGDDRSGFDPYYFAIESGRLKFLIQADDNSWSNLYYNFDSAPAPLNQPMHVAATYDNFADSMKLFLNGTEVASLSTSIVPIGGLDLTRNPGIGIGNLQTQDWNAHFSGTIDELRISDVALSASQLLVNNVTVTPEPASMILFGVGGVAMAFRRFRSKRT